MNPDFVALLRELAAAEVRFRVEGCFSELEVPFLGRDALIRNKRALGRARDLADLELLEP